MDIFYRNCRNSLETKDFDIELQSRVGWDFAHCSLSIGIVWWAVENSFRAYSHLLESFIPTLDDLTNANCEHKWLASISARIEFGTIEKSACVMCVNFATFGDCWACSFFQNLDNEFGCVDWLVFLLLFLCLFCFSSLLSRSFNFSLSFGI